MYPIYLDHNATTPICPEAIEAMARAFRDGYANPASAHRPGQSAYRILEETRRRTAEILGAQLDGPRPDRLIYTSGGTEANNLAVLGLAVARPPAHLVISAIEHSSVIGPAEWLLERGWQLDLFNCDRQGVVRPELLDRLLLPQTRLVSALLANHETGAIQPVAELAAICDARGVHFHTDAVQAVGKMPIDFRALRVGAMSVAAHKFRGPLGIGALVVRHDYPLQPLFHGGHQQAGLRPGTESVPLALGMLAALESWQAQQQEHFSHLEQLRDRFEARLLTALPQVRINAQKASRLPNTSSVAFVGHDAQVLLLALDSLGVACSAGPACASGSTEVSPTLRAMGLDKAELLGSLRFSLGATTTSEEIDSAAARIVDLCRQLG